mgnify:CR=1 FL=1
MPAKLFYFISVILILVLFIGFNLHNHCDISFVFHVFKDVPIYLSLLFSFLLGNIAVLPFLISSRHKIKKAEKQALVYHDVEKVALKPEKRRWFGKKKASEEIGAVKQDA